MREDADFFAASVQSLLNGNHVEARAILSGLPYDDPIARPTRTAIVPFERFEAHNVGPLTKAVAAQIYERDGWRCRYCGRKLVFNLVLLLLRHVFPDFKGVTKGHHLPAHDTEPAVFRVYPSIDHIHPQSYGVSHSDDNLVSCCMGDNESKNNRSGWVLLPIQNNGDWHGLAEYYPALTERACVPLDRGWYTALRQAHVVK